jgi:hypothetical protein
MASGEVRVALRHCAVDAAAAADVAALRPSSMSWQEGH